jgi:ABC-type taurine transport system substrate-binding protein
VDDYEFLLINNEGKTVDSFTDVELADTEDFGDSKNQWYKDSQELYDLARRTALGSEKILNEILADLDDDEVPF